MAAPAAVRDTSHRTCRRSPSATAPLAIESRLLSTVRETVIQHAGIKMGMI
jgi:hypothetical protein